MTRTRLLSGLVGLLVSWIAVSDAWAGDPNFANKYRELRMQQERERASHRVVLRPWGGPTTPSNWWTKTVEPKRPPHPGPCPWPYPRYPRHPRSQLNYQYNQYNYYFAPFSSGYVLHNNFYRY